MNIRDPATASSAEVAQVCKDALDAAYGTDLNIISIGELSFIVMTGFGSENMHSQLMVNIDAVLIPE